MVRTNDWLTRASPASASADAAHLGRDPVARASAMPPMADRDVLGVGADDAALADVDVRRLDAVMPPWVTVTSGRLGGVEAAVA